jgi:hypothetical protein
MLGKKVEIIGLKDKDFMYTWIARMNKVFVSAGESPVDLVKGVPIRDFVFVLYHLQQVDIFIFRCFQRGECENRVTWYGITGNNSFSI